jgi:hypothetical protein
MATARELGTTRISPVQPGDGKRQRCYRTVAATENRPAPAALRFQLNVHGMGRPALATSCVILVNDTTLGCLVESRSK